MNKSLDRRLQAIRSDSAGKHFILVDAKDPNETWGLSSTGRRKINKNGTEYKTLQEFYEDIRVLVKQATLDVMLTSVLTMDILGREEQLFKNSPVTPAVRMNQSTEIWTPRGGIYGKFPSRPFSAATVRQAMYGNLQPKKEQKHHVDLGLYSITLNNDIDMDLRSLEAFKDFRNEAELEGLRYFFEVFDPNIQECGLTPDDIPGFVNDHILRILAGIPRKQQPIFLKIAYHGPQALEELASHDSDLIVGILGGSSGTTYDAFKLIAVAQKYGARAATFGRNIKNSEDPLIFISMLRLIVSGDISPDEAVRAYHSELQKAGTNPIRSLEEDLTLTNPVLQVDG